MPRDQLRRWPFLVPAILAFLTGSATVAAGFLVVMPRVRITVDQTIRSLELTEEALKIATLQADLLRSSSEVIQQSSRVSALTPNAIGAAANTRNATASLLQASAASLEELQAGITGLFIPEEEMGAVVRAMRNLVDVLRYEPPVLIQLRGATRDLSKAVEMFHADMAAFGQRVPALVELAHQAGRLIETSQTMLQGRWIPLGAALLTSLFGLIFILQGALFLALDILCRERFSG
jgi:hypothetical protein